MNLNEIIEHSTTHNREVEFVNPAGERTGWFFELRPENSPEVQEVMSRHRSKIQDLMLKRKNNAVKQANREHERVLIMSHVAGWRWEKGEDDKKGRPAFSKQELKRLLTLDLFGVILTKFIDNETGALEDFIGKSESS